MTGAGEEVYVTSGAIASQVLDTLANSTSWDELSWSETLPPGTDITFEVRASDSPFAQDNTTIPWISLGGTSPVTSGLPSGRYMQWRATLTTLDNGKTPILHDVTVSTGFTVNATVSNAGEATATGVSVTISFSNSLVELEAAETATHSLGDIPGGESKTTSWALHCNGSGTSVISVNITAGDDVNTGEPVPWQNIENDTVTIYAGLPSYGVMIELTWNTDYDDLDSHLIRPGGTYGNVPDDCSYYSMNPDWDGSGSPSSGDPFLDVDDVEGYGPECITLEDPPYEGIYEYKVHFYFDEWPQEGSTATVKIWINGVLVFTESKTLYDDEVWDCAYIEWPSGNVYSSIE